MKKILLPIFLISGLIACDPEEHFLVDEVGTDPNIEFFHVSEEESRATNLGVHHLLGHGYDVTGDYMSESSGRKQIFDLKKVIDDRSSGVRKMHVNTSQGGNEDYENAKQFTENFYRHHDDLRGKASFRNTLETFFPDQDHLKDFVYSDFSIDMIFESHTFFDLPMEKYYAEEFIQALYNNTPEEIVKEYGTHYLETIMTGASVQIIYRTETVNADRIGSSNYGLQMVRHNLFKPLDADVKKLVAEGNFNQQVSFRVKGGDHSKLRIAEVDGMKRIDFTEWQESIGDGNHEMINMVIRPIHLLINDETKQKELKDYIEKYIDENQFQ